METLNTTTLNSVRKLFHYYKSLGDKSFAQLTDAQLQWRPDPEANSIAVIVKHLHGNMMSRWTNFLTSDGEKEWRQRDAEFEADLDTREKVLEKWEEGWACLFAALDGVSPEDLAATIYIRNEGHMAVEAIHRQLGHYAYHVGQVVFLARWMAGEKWTTLSIAKGASKAFNEAKFGQAKRRKHFTDES